MSRAARRGPARTVAHPRLPGAALRPAALAAALRRPLRSALRPAALAAALRRPPSGGATAGARVPLRGAHRLRRWRWAVRRDADAHAVLARGQPFAAERPHPARAPAAAPGRCARRRPPPCLCGDRDRAAARSRPRGRAQRSRARPARCRPDRRLGRRAGAGGLAAGPCGLRRPRDPRALPHRAPVQRSPHSHRLACFARVRARASGSRGSSGACRRGARGISS